MRIALAGIGAAACVAALPSARGADAPPPPQLVAPPGATAPDTPHATEAAPAAPGASAPAPGTHTVAAAASGVPVDERPERGEPAVRHIVIEDESTRIDELRVRNVPQKIVVTSKVGGKSTTYEIITGDGSRDLSPGANTSRGATGQRVWRVLDF